MQRPAAIAFYGFAAVILVDMMLVGWLNPDHGAVYFWLMLVVWCGGLLVGALLIARKLQRGGSFGAAYAYLGALTGMVILGAVMQFARADAPAAPTRLRPLQVARAISGICLLATWIVVIWDSRRSRSFKN